MIAPSPSFLDAFHAVSAPGDVHVVTAPAPSRRRDPVAEDAFVTGQGLSLVDLLDWQVRTRTTILEPPYDDDDTNAVARCMAEAQLPEINRVIAQRERAHRKDAGLPSPADRQFSAWVDVAHQLRDQLPVPEVLVHLNWPIKRVERDRDGRDEYGGPCVVCGGRDRMRAWSTPRSRWWCRVCDTSGDVVSLWRLAHPQLTFRAACEELAAMAGVTA